ncbi:MAG: type II toxin-antitoxin system YafQ family toxin [Bifidobacteriaceae bacterium]|jgi:mRNA interferase YafQ|nr:type II toxin-antitoxin system YafQ family toxin [Bifidobacteriaceae bacterium]
MRTTEREVEATSQFKKDRKRELRGRHRATFDADFLAALALLRADADIPGRYRDHALGGVWQDCRDCHLKPDLVLIYSRPDLDTIRLIRVGSHSELSL